LEIPQPLRPVHGKATTKLSFGESIISIYRVFADLKNIIPQTSLDGQLTIVYAQPCDAIID
jgi:hypothetical protein